jgi:spore coat protein A
MGAETAQGAAPSGQGRDHHMTHSKRAQALTLIVCLALAATARRASAQTYNPLLLPGSNIPQFKQPLPVLDIWKARQPTPATYAGYPAIPTIVATPPAPGAPAHVDLTMCEFTSPVLPPLVAGAAAPATSVWGYVPGTSCPGQAAVRDTYIGPVLVSARGTPTEVTYRNQLGSTATTRINAYKWSTDQTLHWADPLNDGKNACMMKVAMMGPLMWNGQPDPCALNYAGPIAAVPHLHGAEDPDAIDGSPDSWFTSDGSHAGSKYYTRGFVGDVAGLPAPGVAPYVAGAIVRDTTTNAFSQVVQDPATLAFSWAPFTPSQSTYTYPNTQEAAPLWFHDHTLGATRLNVFAGLAGAYYVTDPAEPPLAGLDVADVVPVVLQDRMFDSTGQLFFPADSYAGLVWATNPDHPYWVPEFVGDTVVVNGRAWPFLDVQARRYRFLVLNGSNARTYELQLLNQATGGFGPPMWIISNDGGYLDAPVKIDPALGQTLTIMPGERYEVVVDFAGLAGQNLIFRNTGRTPYPKGGPPQGKTLGRVMQFRVGAATVADTSYDPATLAPLRKTPMVRLATAGALAPGVAPTVARQLTLNEVMGMAANWPSPITGVMTAYPGGPLEILVNNTKWSGMDPKTMTTRPDFQQVAGDPSGYFYSELPKEGETEIWEIVNLTADAHPIHLHLVQFQLLNRQGIATSQYLGAYNALFPGGLFQGGYGPPLDYAKFAPPLNPPYSHGFGGQLVPVVGGNPDVTPFLQGPVLPVGPQESGWKDTVLVPPGAVTRFVVRWAPNDKPAATVASAATFPFDPTSGGRYNYVWHCHIIDHEDNEMMRPDVVVSQPGAVRTYTPGASF